MPLGAVPARGVEASCQVGRSIQFALISPSASGSHAPKPISTAVAGWSWPQGSAPLAMPVAQPRSAGTRSPRQLSSGTTGLSQALGGWCIAVSRQPCRPRVEVVLSIPLNCRASGRDTEPPAEAGRGTRGLCARVPRGCAAGLAAHALPSHGLWLLLKLLLAAEKRPAGRGLGQPVAASTKPGLCCSGGSLPLFPPPQPGCRHCPARSDGVGSRPPAHPASLRSRAGALSPIPLRWKSPRPVRRRSQASIETRFYSFHPSGHSTEHISPLAQQHTRLSEGNTIAPFILQQSGLCHFYTPRGFLCLELTATHTTDSTGTPTRDTHTADAQGWLRGAGSACGCGAARRQQASRALCKGQEEGKGRAAGDTVPLPCTDGTELLPSTTEGAETPLKTILEDKNLFSV